MRNVLLLSVCMLFSSLQATVKSPEDYFGFQPGTDSMLFDYESLISYFQQLDKASDRIEMAKIGDSPMGRPLYIAFISSPDNLSKLQELKEINKELALNSSLSEEQRAGLVQKGKVFVLETLSMHSGEVAPSQASPLIAYELATTSDPLILQWLQDVVLMIVPCHNPDGMDMVVNHYKKYKNTKYDGCSMPGIYHKYVGHDNNRDFVTLSQSDTKAIARIYNSEWYPQVMVEKHQMGWNSARYFVPPMHDPIAENIDAGLWNWTTIFGAAMITDLTKANCTGVSQHYLFDDYWPGSTETALWKNVIAMLTEAASVKYATPIYIEPNELQGYGKGLAEYKKGINMPEPWPGGWWRLSDIVRYEIISTKSILKTASQYRKEILTFRNDMCKDEVNKGKTQAPFYYILPQKQHDDSEYLYLLRLLREHGVRLFELTADVEINSTSFHAGDVVVPLAQPFRAFIKEVLEKQEFPVRHYTPGGEIIKPYDITSWSLPLHRGITASEIDSKSEMLESHLSEYQDREKTTAPEKYKVAIFNCNNNESYKAAFKALAAGNKVSRLKKETAIEGQSFPAGSFVVSGELPRTTLNNLLVAPTFLAENAEAELEELRLPRIALVETFFHDMDAGWTRFVFDEYGIPFTVVRPGDIKALSAKKYDILIFPDSDKDVLTSGKYKSGDVYRLPDYPPEFTKGIGKDGMQKIAAFIQDGGNVLAWGRSTLLFTEVLERKINEKESEKFQLPVQDISKSAAAKGLYCPGSLCSVELLENHPLTLGMPSKTGVFYRGRPLFSTSVPSFDMDRRVIGTFPEKDILLSGYCEKEEQLSQKSIMVWLKKGKGQLVLYGFSPQFRASTQGTLKLLFNALFL